MKKKSYLDIARKALAKIEPTRSKTPSDPAEREAIQWVECGPTAALDAALHTAIAEWIELTGQADRQDVPVVPGVPESGVPAADVPTAVPANTAIKDELPGTTRTLIGNGFQPIPPTIPPAAILATPLALCPCCGKCPVLPELRETTGGRCWDCWVQAKSPAADDEDLRS